MSYTHRATDADFQTKVLVKSNEVPVLVDFYSPRMGGDVLGPTLEKLAAEYAGAFEVVQVDVDQSPRVAMMFQLQSVPTVYLVEGGRPVDGFAGNVDEAEVRQFLDRYVERPAADPLELAAAAMAEGRYDAAAAGYRAALEKTPGKGEALVGMARVAIASGDLDAARGWIDRVDDGDPAHDAAERLRGMLGFGEDAGDRNALRARVEADSKDVEAWYALGATEALAGDIDAAFAAFLEVVGRDRTYRDDAGRLALLSLFDLVGATDPRVIKARRRLASLLF